MTCEVVLHSRMRQLARVRFFPAGMYTLSGDTLSHGLSSSTAIQSPALFLTTQFPVISSNRCATAGSSRCPISMASLLSTGPSMPTFLLQSLYGVSKWFTPIIVPTSDEPMPLDLSSSHSSWVAGFRIV